MICYLILVVGVALALVVVLALLWLEERQLKKRYPCGVCTQFTPGCSLECLAYKRWTES
jgi:hypothetical protein